MVWFAVIGNGLQFHFYLFAVIYLFVSLMPEDGPDHEASYGFCVGLVVDITVEELVPFVIFLYVYLLCLEYSARDT